MPDRLDQTLTELALEPAARQKLEQLLAPLQVRDTATYEHSLRVGESGRKIALFLDLEPKIAFLAGLFHDLGKLGVPLETLQKTGNWTEADAEIVEDHVLHGYELLRNNFGFTAEIILLHHSFQENNYPKTLPPYLHSYSEESRRLIVEYARLLALADVYDALHRVNGKFGRRTPLSDVEVRLELEKAFPDQGDLIAALYTAQILS
jgi:putative nucleotidyltransferase with HDIG domain